MESADIAMLIVVAAGSASGLTALILTKLAAQVGPRVIVTVHSRRRAE